jgi:DNA-binding CsgD family transcriptional regulator
MDLRQETGGLRCAGRSHMVTADDAIAIGVARMVFYALDQLSVGIILVDRSAKVVFANVAARSLSTDDGALLLNSRLTSTSASHRFGELIRSVLEDTSVRAMSLPSPGDGQPLMVLVSPVRGAELDRSDIRSMRNAAALVMICNPDRRAQIPAAWMTDAYGLTLAEARVALAVSAGATIADTARRLRISPNTVKTHLRRVYEKTGTNRQAELSRLVATIGLARGGAPGT